MKKVNWVLDADLRSFFDTLKHAWLVQFIEHRVADRRIVRLIQKWLAAGVLAEGKWIRSEVGTVQGGSISPLLANIYLHTCSTSGPSDGGVSRRAGMQDAQGQVFGAGADDAHEVAREAERGQGRTQTPPA